MTDVSELTTTYTDRIRSVCSAVADRDVDRILSHFDDDCVFVDGATGSEAGREGLLDFLEEMWSIFPDFAPRVAAAHVDQNTIGVVFEATGTLAGTGDASTPGKQVSWLMAAFSTFDPDSLAILRDIYFGDAAAFEQKVLAARSA